jgi:hypothetical protein
MISYETAHFLLNFVAEAVEVLVALLERVTLNARRL